MSERWKYQIKYGGIWGIIVTVFMIVFEAKNAPIKEQLLQPDFYIRAIGFILVGIFVLGYFNWRTKTKRENNS